MSRYASDGATWGGPPPPNASVLAVIRVAFDSEPTAKQIQAVLAVAAEAGPLLTRQRNLKEAEQAQSRLSQVLRLMREVATAANHAAVVEAIVQAAYRLLVPQRVTVFLVDEAR